MKVEMYELSNMDACAAKRNFHGEIRRDAGDYMKKAGIIKRAINGCLTGSLKLGDVEEYLQKEFTEINYASNRQRELQAYDAYRQVARYVGSEKRPLMPGIQTIVSLGQGLTVTTAPDYLYVTDKSIEVIRIKCSKPSLTSREVYTDLGLYALLCYGRAMLPGGMKKTITASYYFLRKSSDRASGEKPNFNENFFDNASENIISIQEEYDNIPGFHSKLDDIYQPVVHRYLQSLPKEECSADDCANCLLFDLCKFTTAPLVINRAPVNHSLHDLKLTPSQEKVIEYEKGICRVNAGAGAGKTMVIALRTATLLNKGVKPEELLLITFTNAGAEEMRTRICLILEDFGLEIDTSAINICTFNAFGDSILKEEFTRFGFKQPPKVIDDIERSRIITNLLNQYPVKDLDYRNFDANTKNCKGALAITKKLFDIIKAGQYSVADKKEVREKMGGDARFCSYPAVEEVIALYDKYDEQMRDNNLIEFNDQEVLLFELLRENPFYMEKFGFKHIIVDEFQDTSERQIELIKKFTECPTFESLMVVGDDSQAIFSFRDTSPEFILNFDKIMGGKVDDIMLMENHRSTPEILNFANAINETRSQYISKKLVATRPHGKPVRVKGFYSRDEEAQYVINDIKGHLQAGTKPEDIAIIAYTKYELMKMADLLEKEDIQTVMLNPEPLIENSRVRAAISLCKAIKDTGDTKDMLVYENARKPEHDLLTASEEELDRQIKLAEKAIDEYNAKKSSKEKKEYLIDMLKALDENDDEVYESLLDTLSVKPLSKIFEYVGDFYRFGSNAAIRRTHNYPGVVLTTAHSSKGMEWPVIYNMISKYDSQDLHKNSSVAMNMTEEHKRLFFVSATRARDELIITGQYDAFGKRGDYTYNQFLLSAFECAGQPVTCQDIEVGRARRLSAIRTQKKEEKAKKQLEKQIPAL